MGRRVHGVAPDGTEVLIYESFEDYEASCTCGGEDPPRCDLLVQVDAGDRRDRASSRQKTELLRPGGLFGELWAMSANDLAEDGDEEEDSCGGRAPEVAPLRFTEARIERRLGDWLIKA